MKDVIGGYLNVGTFQVNLENIWKFSSYHTKNTPRLLYEDK